MAEPTEQLPAAPAADVPVEQPVEQPAEELTKEGAAEEAVEEIPDLIPAPSAEEILSMKVSLADLSAKGAHLYAHQQYEEAAEIFSEASNLQAQINGEMAPENAEILFHYGRSLFKVGQSKSDVLGGNAAVAEKQAKPAPKKKEAKAESSKAAESTPAGTKPQNGLFQFTGDENFDDDSDDEEEHDHEHDHDEEEEEDDDLAIAFEVLDMARVCYLKLLTAAEEAEASEGKGKEAKTEDTPSVRHIKERLAETHDALHEISLENERYPSAVEDGRTALEYKQQLYPIEHGIIAEAHYKLSLALEFASVTTSGEDGAPAKREDMDQELRGEAVKEMERAIESCQAKLKKLEVKLAEVASPDESDETRRAIADLKEVTADMQNRLTELRADPIDTKKLLGGDVNPLGSILGAVAGETAAETKARVDEAKEKATDLSSLVRKKAPAATPAAVETTNGKRKAEDETADQEAAAKKAKTEEPEETKT